jgi:hypothetical protein
MIPVLIVLAIVGHQQGESLPSHNRGDLTQTLLGEPQRVPADKEIEFVAIPVITLRDLFAEFFLRHLRDLFKPFIEQSFSLEVEILAS